MSYVIQTHNLTKCFHNKEVIKNVNLKIKQGEIFGFLGANGAGKSTIMKLIMNLMQPTSGTIEVFGKDNKKNFGESLKRMGAIIEYPIFYEKLTARENLELHCEYMGVYHAEDVEETLRLVNLSGIDGKAVGHFSLGMKQRLALARAMITKPELLILDEPINGLDPEGIAQVRDLIKMLSRDYGMTIMISSHILSEIEQIADTIGIIHEGKLIKEISMNTIHDAEEEYIEILSEEIKNVAVMLDMNFGIQAIKMMDDRTLRVYDSTHSVNELTKALGDSHISIDSISKKKTTLEEYFLKLTKGGEVHV